MYKSIIDNLTDEEIIEIAGKSNGIIDFYKNLGYSSWGKNSRKKIKERLEKLNITIESKKVVKQQEEETNQAGNQLNLNPKDLGFIGESKFTLLCARNNIRISKPLNDNYPYDFVIEKDGIFKSVQVKTTEKLCNDVSIFDVRKSYYNKDGYYKVKYNDIDFDFYFLYNIEIDEGYIINKKEVKNSSNICIRKKQARNFQTKNIKFAKDYLFENKIDDIFSMGI